MGNKYLLYGQWGFNGPLVLCWLCSKNHSLLMLLRAYKWHCPFPRCSFLICLQNTILTGSYWTYSLNGVLSIWRFQIIGTDRGEYPGLPGFVATNSISTWNVSVEFSRKANKQTNHDCFTVPREIMTKITWNQIIKRTWKITWITFWNMEWK